MSEATPPSRELIFFADAIRFSISIARAEANRARERVSQLEVSSEGGASNEHLVVPAVAALWSCVDAVHRLRELLEQAPRLKKNQPVLQLFLRNTVNVEPLRHYVQHLRGEITQLPAQPTPIWGVVSWVSATDPNRCFTVFTGTAFSGTSVYSCSYDTWQRRFAQQLILSVNNTSVDIPSLVSEIEALEPLVEQWATSVGCPRPPAYPVVSVSIGTNPVAP
jgi:hypothetical protein